jgi:uncharacterized protein
MGDFNCECRLIHATVPHMATALITGASTGIGRELSRICARAGYDLALVARNEAQLNELAAQLHRETGRRSRIVAKDLSRVTAPTEVFDATKDLLPEIELLINNAGIGMLGHFAELDADRQMQMLQLNVNALTHMTRLFVPSMLARGKGRILNVASTAAFQPGPLMAVYYASKAYVLSLSEALHNELQGRGVTVTALCPGPTRTEFQRRAGMESTRLFTSFSVMDSGSVARAGFDAMMAGRPLAIPGAINRITAFMTRFAPIQLAAAIARSMQE